MVTDVNYWSTMMNETKSTSLITRDLLGGGGRGRGSEGVDSAKELDLDLHVPSGYEKRLDLKSGKVYIQRCKSPNISSSSSDGKQESDQTVVSKQLQDLNFPPSSKKPLSLFDETSLDLNLVNISNVQQSYESVCTLDKVKFALERAAKEPIKKRSNSMSNSCSSPTSNTSSVKDDHDHVEQPCEPYAVSCPSCFLYVLILRSNPRCPHCNVTIPFPTSTATPPPPMSPVAMKKARIDLNFTMR